MTIPTVKDVLDELEVEEYDTFDDREIIKRWGSDGHARNGQPMENIYGERY